MCVWGGAQAGGDESPSWSGDEGESEDGGEGGGRAGGGGGARGGGGGGPRERAWTGFSFVDPAEARPAAD